MLCDAPAPNLFSFHIRWNKQTYIYNIFNSTLEGTAKKRSASNSRQRLISSVYICFLSTIFEKNRRFPFQLPFCHNLAWWFQSIISCNLGYFVFYLIYCGCKEQCWVTLFLFFCLLLFNIFVHVFFCLRYASDWKVS